MIYSKSYSFPKFLFLFFTIVNFLWLHLHQVFGLLVMLTIWVNINMFTTSSIYKIKIFSTSTDRHIASKPSL